MQFITENSVRTQDSFRMEIDCCTYIITNEQNVMQVILNTPFENYSISDLINLIQKDIIKILSIKFY
jgi:hypothetical protein